MIRDFKIPIFLINEKEEESSAFHKCLDFTKKFKIRNSWFPSKTNFDNIMEEARKKFYVKIKEFLKNLISFDLNNSISEDQTNVNTNCLKDYYYKNKILLNFLRNKERQENDMHKEENKKEILEKRYIIEMEEGKFLLVYSK